MKPYPTWHAFTAWACDDDIPPELTGLIQQAHAAERAAARAYRGHRLIAGKHAKEIWNIERDEWVHRATLRRIMDDLHITPKLKLEIWYGIVGIVIALLCPLVGMRIATQGAAKLEHGNANEYNRMAFLLRRIGRKDLAFLADEMAVVEEYHERQLSAIMHKTTAKYIQSNVIFTNIYFQAAA